MKTISIIAVILSLLTSCIPSHKVELMNGERVNAYHTEGAYPISVGDTITVCKVSSNPWTITTRQRDTVVLFNTPETGTFAAYYRTAVVIE